MPIQVKCPTCQKDCAVQEEFAGAMVRCPHCGNIIVAPRPGEAPAVSAPPPSAPSPSYTMQPPVPTPPTPVGQTSAAATSGTAAPSAPAGPGFVDTVNQFAQRAGLTPLQKNLVFAGLGCLVFLIVDTFLPWAGGSLGITIWFGVFNFLLSAAACAFVIVAAMLKSPPLFNCALISAALWGEHAAFWRLIDVAYLSPVGAVGIGLILAFFGSLGAAGTLGFVAFQRWKGKLV